MPIYAYRCENCGHAKDVLQKISDPVLTVCPVCGEPSFRKQVTAAGFQLKGSGWYVTDFRGDKSAGKKAEPGAEGAGKAEGGAESAPKGNGEGATPAAPAAGASKPDAAAAPAAAPAPAPAPSTPSGGKPG